MKTACGAFVSCGWLMLLVVLLCGTVNAEKVLFDEPCDRRDAFHSDPAGGKLEAANGCVVLHDIRKGRELSDVSPPMWTISAKGTAPANSYLEVRVKAPRNVTYWFDLVDAKNKSIATVDWQEGTGEWQTRRAPFSGQYGSAGDDLFIRIKKLDESSDDSVQIDSIRIIAGDPPSASAAVHPRDPENNLALAKHECLVLSSSFQDVSSGYTDNLIDGKLETAWRSFSGVTSRQWVELRWEYPLQINEVCFRPAANDNPEKLLICVPEKNQWREIQKVTAPAIWPASGIGAKFETVNTDRIRVFFDTSSAVALSEIEVFGPPQPLIWKLRPYWQAHYIWYPEPDKQIKAEPRYFRKTFDLADLSKVTGAFLQTRSNDGYVAYINGKEVARGSVAIKPADVKSAVRQGRNCLAFEARAAKDPGWPLMTLLGQLNINAGENSQIISTDETWACSQKAANGWNQPEFDESSWAHAMVCATPPDEPWGRIPYFDVSDAQVIELASGLSLTAAAGEETQANLNLHATAAVDQDLFLVLKAGEVEVNSDRSNYLVASSTATIAKASFDSSGNVAVKFKLALPGYSPAMRVPLRLEIYGTTAGKTFKAQCGKMESGVIGDLTLTRRSEESNAKSGNAAKIVAENGVAKISTGDVLQSPLLWALQSPSLQRFGDYSATGVHLYHLQIYPYRIGAAEDYEKTHLPFIDQHLRHLLAVDPTAKVLVEMDLRDSAAWAEAHPDDRLVTAQGTKKAASMASAAYAKDVSDFVRKVVRFVQAQPYRDGIIGYIPEIAEPESAMCGADENAFQSDRLKLNIGDYNPQAITYFRKFLREKYANDESKLRAAWKDSAVTFDSASPKLEELTREGEQGGVFRDPSKGRMPYDYFECLSTMVPNFVVENVGKVIKQETGGKALVGFYYGYVVETLRSVNNPGALLQGNHFHFDKIIDSPYIDFFMSPLQYEHRMAGDRMFPFQPVDSIRLHKKLYIAEEDLRTHISGLTSYGRQRSEEESVAVLKNHLGTALIRGTGAWLADWSSGSGHSRTAIPFFDDPALLKTISSVKSLYDQTLSLPRTGGAEIAVIVSPQTMYYHDVAYASVIYKNLVTEMLYTQMPYIGAPFDIYQIQDLNSEKVKKQYKLYIFLNPFHLESPQRAAIQDLKRDGKTMLFFYAPGYVDDQKGPSADGIASLTGMQIKLSNEKRVQQCRTVANQHPVLRGIPAGTEYVAGGFDYAPETARVHPTAFGPSFAIVDQSVTALAKNQAGETSLAAKDFGNWKCVYATVPYLDTHALRNVASWAGVHLYTDEKIVVEACDQFVLLHSGFDKDREMVLKLPVSSDVEDAVTGVSVAKATKDLKIKLPRSTTLLYRVKKKDQGVP